MTHDENLKKTGRWGKKGVGAIIYNPVDKTFALGYRSAEVLEPFTFGTIGGAIDPKENEKDALKREIEEELGVNEDFKFQKLYKYKEKNFEYTTYIAIAPRPMQEMDIQLNWENKSLKYQTLSEWKREKDLHYGIKKVLEDKKANEILKEWLDFEIEDAENSVKNNYKVIGRLNKEEKKIKSEDTDIQAFINSVKSRKFKQNNKLRAKINKFK